VFYLASHGRIDIFGSTSDRWRASPVGGASASNHARHDRSAVGTLRVPTRRTVRNRPRPRDHRVTLRSRRTTPQPHRTIHRPGRAPTVGGLLPPSRGGSPFTALVAAVETLIATVLLGVSPTVAPAVVALVTFAVYSVDHVADADTDAASTPNRALVARRYGDQLMMIAAALAYGLAVAVAVTGGPLALARSPCSPVRSGSCTPLTGYRTSAAPSVQPLASITPTTGSPAESARRSPTAGAATSRA